MLVYIYVKCIQYSGAMLFGVVSLGGNVACECRIRIFGYLMCSPIKFRYGFTGVWLYLQPHIDYTFLYASPITPNACRQFPLLKVISLHLNQSNNTNGFGQIHHFSRTNRIHACDSGIRILQWQIFHLQNTIYTKCDPNNTKHFNSTAMLFTWYSDIIPKMSI